MTRGHFATVLMVAVFCLLQAVPATAQPLELSAPEAKRLSEAGELTLIDVRTPAEWRQTGVPAGARLIPMQHPGGPQGFLEAILAEVHGDRQAPIGVICRTGNRSGQVQIFLRQQGFDRVYNVSEGMAGSKAGPGWLKRGLPVVAPAAEGQTVQRP